MAFSYTPLVLYTINKIVDKCLKHVRKALIISVPCSPHRTGRIIPISEHRYLFNEKTFANYNCKTIKITEFVDTTQARCIIYEILP